MTIKIIDGFDEAGLIDWSATNAVMSTEHKIAGTGSLKCDVASGDAYISYAPNYYAKRVSFYLYFDNMEEDEVTILSFGEDKVKLTLTVAGYIRLWDYDSVNDVMVCRGNSYVALSHYSWYRISFGIGDALYSWVRINGSLQIKEVCADTLSYAVKIGLQDCTEAATIYFDCLVVDDTFSTDEIYPTTSDLRVYQAYPTGTGTYQQWDATGSPHYATIDDADNDADYISTPTKNLNDTFTFTSTTTLELDEYESILLLKLYARAKTNFGAYTVPYVAVYDGTTVTATLGQVGTDYLWKSLFLTVHPTLSTAWTNANYDLTELGIRSSTIDRNHYVSSLFAYILVGRSIEEGDVPTEAPDMLLTATWNNPPTHIKTTPNGTYFFPVVKYDNTATRIYKSTDFGKTWEVGADVDFVCDYVFKADSTYYIAQNGSDIRRATELDGTWTIVGADYAEVNYLWYGFQNTSNMGVFVKLSSILHGQVYALYGTDYSNVVLLNSVGYSPVQGSNHLAAILDGQHAFILTGVLNDVGWALMFVVDERSPAQCWYQPRGSTYWDYSAQEEKTYYGGWYYIGDVPGGYEYFNELKNHFCHRPGIDGNTKRMVFTDNYTYAQGTYAYYANTEFYEQEIPEGMQLTADETDQPVAVAYSTVLSHCIKTQTPGIYRSTDFGENWAFVHSPLAAPDNSHTTGIVINPYVSKHAFTWGEYGTCYSDDGGATWTCNSTYGNFGMGVVDAEDFDEGAITVTGLKHLYSRNDGVYRLTAYSGGLANLKLVADNYEPQDINADKV